MAQKPIATEQLKQILQFQVDGISIREIAPRVGISRNSVRKYLSRLKASDKNSDRDR
jgi:transposase